MLYTENKNKEHYGKKKYWNSGQMLFSRKKTEVQLYDALE